MSEANDPPPDEEFVDSRSLRNAHQRRTLAWLVMVALVVQIFLAAIWPVINEGAGMVAPYAGGGLLFWMALTPVLIRLLMAQPLPRTRTNLTILDWILLIVAAIGISWLITSAAAVAFVIVCFPVAITGGLQSIELALILGVLAALLVVGGGAYLAVAWLIRRR